MLNPQSTHEDEWEEYSNDFDSEKIDEISNMMNEMHLSGGAFQALTQRLSKKKKKDDPNQWSIKCHDIMYARGIFIIVGFISFT